jgi:hypothetical protein
VDCRHSELSKAGSVDEVLAVTRAYLSAWSVDDLAGLPVNCRPAAVQDPEDIEHWADRLLTATRTQKLVYENEARLERLTNHFLIASVRIRQLAS